jgi:hypothetical protein
VGAPRKQAAFSVEQWVALNAAFVRVKTALTSADLAEHDLPEHIRSGRLASAMRRMARDGSVTFELLKPSFWKGLQLLETHELGADGLAKRSGKVQVRGLDVKFVTNSKLWFFVARSELDRLYPVGGAQLDDNDDESSTRRKPGPRPTQNWKLHVAGEVDRLVKAGRPVPPASVLAQFCEDTLGWQPDIRGIQRLIKALL